MNIDPGQKQICHDAQAKNKYVILYVVYEDIQVTTAVEFLDAMIHRLTVAPTTNKGQTGADMRL